MTKKPHRAPRHQSAQSHWWMLGPLVAAIGVLIFFAGAPNVQTGEPAMNFSTQTTTGETVSLGDYQGDVVMLNFWATWCTPCQAEMPTIESAYQEYQDAGFTVLAINNAEAPAQVSRFQQVMGLTFPILLDEQRDIQRQYGINSYPTSVFLDRNGDIYAVHTGAVSSGQLIDYIEDGLTR